jgi:hypothetical protein
MSQGKTRAPGEAPAPGMEQPAPSVAHTGAGAGTALDAMLRTRQMRPRRDALPEPDPPAAPPNADEAGQPGA